jgi:hypothetical protein
MRRCTGPLSSDLRTALTKGVQQFLKEWKGCLPSLRRQGFPRRRTGHRSFPCKNFGRTLPRASYVALALRSRQRCRLPTAPIAPSPGTLVRHAGYPLVRTAACRRPIRQRYRLSFQWNTWAITHNSEYGSFDAAKKGIDPYFRRRNEHFLRAPKRAGFKIWVRNALTGYSFPLRNVRQSRSSPAIGKVSSICHPKVGSPVASEVPRILVVTVEYPRALSS